MPFPESPRVVYGKSPLTEVICQLRFPTILRIGTSEPADFQDKIRQEYPLYALQQSPLEQLPSELAGIVAQLNLPLPPSPPLHRFATRSSQRSITLTQDFLALKESDYSRWEVFREETQKAENALRSIYGPAFYSRIGLRYRDLISRKKLGLSDVQWNKLLKPPMCCLLTDSDIAESTTEMQSRAVVRIPDILDAKATIVYGLVKPTGSDDVCYLIDADFAIEKTEGLDEPFTILDKFNRLAGNFFRWAIADSLHGAMAPQPI